MPKKWIYLFGSLCLLFLAIEVSPTYAQISYTSQPDQVYVFFNDVAYVQDELELPGGVDVQVVLPQQVFVDTLILRENEERVQSYRVSRADGQVIISWASAESDDLRQVSLEYLMSGMRWQPKYDMVIQADNESVELDFFAEVTQSALNLDAVDLHLIAGWVDTTQPIDTVSTVTTNQYIAGYDEPVVQSGTTTGVASIQHVYDVGQTSVAVGEVLYIQLESGILPARRLYLWNASYDNEVTVIYKVRNESDLPFAEGIVRSYQDGFFLGSDFMELTPIGSEGSVTIGSLKDVRVRRDETRQGISGIGTDTQHTVTLTLSNFGSDTITVEAVDIYPQDAVRFRFDVEPEYQPGNLLRWEITLEPGEERVLTYTYETP